LFKAANEAATLSRVLHDPLPSLRDAAPHISKGVADVVMKALERDVNKRMGTCAEFADALERAGAASGELGSPRDVQQYMDAVLGQDIRFQREAVRAWTAQADSTVGPPPILTPTGGASAPGVETQSSSLVYPSGGGKRWGLVLVLVALGIGGFFGYRTLTGGETNGAPSQPTAAAPAPTPVAEPSPDPVPETDDDVLPLAEVIEDGNQDDGGDNVGKANPRPRPGPRASPSPAPSPAPAPTPAPSPGPSPKQKPKPGPLAVLDSNPYR
jgi:hypothetical protein